MGRLSEWCSKQPAWAVDAMHRAAMTATLSPENVMAVVARVLAANGLPSDDEYPCVPFAETSIVAAVDVPDDVILRSIGPLQGLDRLAHDQTLHFAHSGITIVFGDNGSGKSGYTRALRKLCNARIDAVLQGDVFADGPEAPKAIGYSYYQGDGAQVTETWTDGLAKPPALRGLTLLDSDNLRIYVDGRNEILYLPPEVACVGRLADLYRAAGTHFRSLIDTAAVRCGAPFGGHYQPGTTAAALIALLQIGTSRADLPTEEQLRAAAQWSDESETELAQATARLVQGPAAVAARCERIAAACDTAAADLERNTAPLDHLVVGLDWPMIIAKTETKRVVDTLAAEQLGGQPLSATGSPAWRSLYLTARRFAAETYLRRPTDAFEAGDPCPLCQQPLEEDAVRRLAVFDALIAGQANQEARVAAETSARRLAALQALVLKPDAELRTLLAEAAAEGPAAAALVQETIAYNEALRARRLAAIRQFETEEHLALAPLAPSPSTRLRGWAVSLGQHAAHLRASDSQTAATSVRVAELTAQRQLHGQIEEIVARRRELDGIHAWKACEAALGTAPLSRLITTLRKELTSPALEARIAAEIEGLGLQHVPLRFSDESAKGTSVFEVELATDKKAKKARVLSEGEQRALSLACFLAETHVAGKRSAIILDDPVTSLDHGRVRRVARRLVDEAAKGRQIIVFTHNLVFYHELMLNCVDRDAPVSALSCLIQQGPMGEFGMVSVGDEPWVARKVKDREVSLKALIDAIADAEPTTSASYRPHCTSFYAALRETWERAVEEVVLNDVVRRFGSDVGTLRLGGVEVSDDDFMIVHRAMKRASERSGHDQAAGRQIEMPTKDQMRSDLRELTAFRAAKTKSNNDAAERRKAKAARPPRAVFG